MSRRVTVDTPKYRTFWPRFWAGFIDAFVLLPLGWVDSAVWDNISATAFLVPWFVLYSLSDVAYTIVLHGLYGQTIGKRLMGVKVLDKSEARLSMGQAVLRDSVLLAFVAWGLFLDLPTVIAGNSPYAEGAPIGIARLIALYAMFAWFVLELLTMLTNNKRRALHDFIAGSVVVRLARTGDAPNEKALRA
jgi:uncharacterized RDD family membrane protein YckC